MKKKLLIFLCCILTACGKDNKPNVPSSDASIVSLCAYTLNSVRKVDTLAVTKSPDGRTFTLSTPQITEGEEAVDMQHVHLQLKLADKAIVYFDENTEFDLRNQQIITVYAADHSRKDYLLIPYVTLDKPKAPARKNYELSYWIDMDLIGNHLRGYWYEPQSIGEDAVTPEVFVENACKNLSSKYGADKLYVIYHRQYEVEAAKAIFKYWKKCGDKYSICIVPTVVPQNYSANESLNFTDQELKNLILWSKQNINPDEFGLYDVYTRDQQTSLQGNQINSIITAVGNVLVRVGMQPGVVLNSYYKYAVQDTWSAECQGTTNALWENPVTWNGSTNYGRNLLMQWIYERINNTTDCRAYVWNLIPVAWDYDNLTNNPYSYACPGDNALTNDPPISGRVTLCAKYIAACYGGDYSDARFGVFSCDLHILQANSAGCGKDNPSFYKALRSDLPYTGYFSNAIDEIGTIYHTIRKNN